LSNFLLQSQQKLLKRLTKSLSSSKRTTKYLRKKIPKKSYTQALTLTSNIKKILKIKETFPKIENIQKFINNDSKLKPKLNITTKRLFRKQVIVPMNNENKSKFMKASSAHITNFNRTLKNIKSEVMADFVCTDQVDVMIVTNKVKSSLDLQTIEKCIKNSNYIDTEKVKVPCLCCSNHSPERHS